jgi:hypothetical protein
LASLDQGKSIPHLVGLATQCFDIIMIAHHSDLIINANLKKLKITIDSKKEKSLEVILEDCLSVLASVNKENGQGKITQAQQMASKKVKIMWILIKLIINFIYSWPTMNQQCTFIN